MDVIADLTGLSALAGLYEENAVTVGAVSGPAPRCAGVQPTAAAVQAAHTDVAATGATLVARLQDTAAAVTTAVSGFASTDAHSAARLTAVGAAAYRAPVVGGR